MKTDVKIYQYNGIEIDFEINDDNSIMPNATKMAKCFIGKKVNDFLRLDSTKEFINVLENKYGLKINSNCGDSRNYKSEINSNCGDSPLETDFPDFQVSENILKITSGRYGGTWMHELLALKFAAWLNPHFELWVYETIHKLMVIIPKLLTKNLKRQHEIDIRLKEVNRAITKLMLEQQDLKKERKKLTVDNYLQLGLPFTDPQYNEDNLTGFYTKELPLVDPSVN